MRVLNVSSIVKRELVFFDCGCAGTKTGDPNIVAPTALCTEHTDKSWGINLKELDD